jgi:hypothetical protein
MKTSDAILRCKPQNARALGDVLGISRQAVHAWGGTIPQLRVYQLRALKPAWFRKSK